MTVRHKWTSNGVVYEQFGHTPSTLINENLCIRDDRNFKVLPNIPHFNDLKDIPVPPGISLNSSKREYILTQSLALSELIHGNFIGLQSDRATERVNFYTRDYGIMEKEDLQDLGEYCSTFLDINKFLTTIPPNVLLLGKWVGLDYVGIYDNIMSFDRLILYAVYDQNSRRFLSFHRAIPFFRELQLNYASVISSGKISEETLYRMLIKFKSLYTESYPPAGFLIQAKTDDLGTAPYTQLLHYDYDLFF